jgi:hypothetical protein
VSEDRTDEPAAVDNPTPQAEAYRDAKLLLIAVDA